jgi:hypothetical protein
MRFAWQRENSPDPAPLKESFASRLVFTAYNVVWWIPVVLPFARVMNYRTGFIAFFIVTAVRAAANLYRNNALTLEQAEIFPFRAP